MPQFSCNLGNKPRAFPHYWEHTVGSCHATLGLRSDWQKQIKQAHDELGFRHVRFHGLLDDDMGTLLCEQGKFVYSFFNIDQVFDDLLAMGMRPFVELSFMPSALSSGDKTVFHYHGNVTPPKDPKKWAVLIEKLARHWCERYGVSEVRRWFFEVWNEPNLDAFWKGSQKDYFEFYRVTAQALKKVDVKLRVGGPATAKSEWIPEFLDFCKRRRVPVDFVTTHHYPTDAFGQPGDDTLTQLAEAQRGILRQQTAQASLEAQDKPLYYTEWATSSNPFDNLHDEPYAAAFAVKTVMENRGLVEGYSYWTFSDIFEENYFSSKPFHGGFGLLNIYGVPKPAYHAFALLHRLGDVIYPTEGSHETVDTWVTGRGKVLKVMMTNGNLPRHPLKKEKVEIKLHGAKAVRSASIERIDENHANARKIWLKMDAPESLRPRQVEALKKKSALVPEKLKPRLEGSSVNFEIELPAQGTACLTVELQ